MRNKAPILPSPGPGAIDQSDDARARLAAIVESSDDAIIGETLDGIVTTWNRAAERLYGFSAEEAIGRSIIITVPSDRLNELHNYMSHVRRGELVDHLETVRLRKDGSRLDVSITVSPIRDDSGTIIGLSKSSRDITERRRFEAELWRKNIELELALRAKDTFLASMSHELRTPLNSIIGFTGTMLMKLPGELNDDQERQLQLIQFSARHLLSLINDLLNLAKVQSGKAELSLEPVRVSAALEEVGATLRPGAEGKGLSFGVRLLDEDIEINTDRRSLIQILMNLTTNAIKFTDKGGIRMDVRRIKDPTRGRPEVAFRVEDTGFGIRAEDQKRLFEAFEQFHRDRSQPEAGSGLGLHLSQRMANLLGGRIEVASQEGKGSAFTLFLPER
ncbi:MAG TPA: PAS domain S-box protein [Candidatus Saccharimonadales bacterium]|nr:PAS domain S-box protein [Candidatus Saccharimonadales bacterium]